MEEILDEVDVDIRKKNPEAKEKLVECRKWLKEVSSPNKKALLKDIRQRIVERETRANRVFNVKKEKRYFQRGTQDYRLAILYLIDKFEELQKKYDSGNSEECGDIMDIIAAGLDDLPNDIYVAVLREQYDKWNAKLSSLLN